MYNPSYYVFDMIWKSGEDWVQHNPHKGHPCYEEWMKQKEKESKDDKNND